MGLVDTTPAVEGLAPDGSPPNGNPVQVGGTDGANMRTLLVDASGRPVVVGPGTAGTPAGGIVTVQGVAGGTEQPISVASLPLPTGAATAANQVTQLTALQLIDDLPHAMNAAFNKAAAIGGQLDDAATTAATEDNVAPVRITAQRALHSNLRDADGNPVTVTLDGSIRRLEVLGKVSVVGSLPPPATNPVTINADNPLSVGAHDTSYTIPNGQTFYLQNLVAGNEDPTKGASVEIIYNNGTEHLVARAYMNGTSITLGFGDVSKARDGTVMVGNGSHSIVVRRAKFSGTNIAIDAVVSGYTV